jgi:hypothetical protein
MQVNSLSTNIILTGLPRSGTTLTCHLLNKLPACVALHEPLIPLDLVSYNKPELVDLIVSYFNAQREQILTTGTAASKSFGGKVPDNPLSGIDKMTGKRIRVLDGRIIQIDKNLPNNFSLVIKQPAFFTAILENLTKSNLLSCFAVVRNPLSVLLSWNTVEMPVANGRVPAAEAFDLELKSNLDQIADIYDRQVFLLNWFFEKYLNHLPKDNILFYEGTIKSQGRSLSVIQTDAKNLNEPLSSKNTNNLYDARLRELFIQKLLQKKDGAFWRFYSEPDILA